MIWRWYTRHARSHLCPAAEKLLAVRAYLKGNRMDFSGGNGRVSAVADVGG